VVYLVSGNTISPCIENMADSTAHWKKCLGKKEAGN